MLGHRGGELRNRGRMAAGSELGAEPVLEDRGAQLGEPVALRGGKRAREAPQRLAPPAGQRAPQVRRRPVRCGETTLHLRGIELCRGTSEPVPPRFRGEQARAQCTAEPTDIGADEARAGRRRLIAPDVLDDPLWRHDLPLPQQQRCEHGALANRAERKLLAAPPGADRSQNLEPHRRHRRATPRCHRCVP